jgi:hypothetical protein
LPVLARSLYNGLEATAWSPHDRIPIPSIPSHGINSLWNSYAPIPPLFGGAQGELARAPLQEEIDNPSLIQSELEIPPQSKPLSRLEHAKVVHTAENQMRIRRLSTREQAIVTTDGGNTAESQQHVLDTIELYPADSNNKRVWAEVPMSLPSGKETIEYHCKAPGCDNREVKFQKARQHFVSCHVAEACWGCPIDGCTHVGKYKRLDDLKHHHMVPFHGIDYTRNRKRETPARPTNVSTTEQESSNPVNLSSSSLLDRQALTIAIPSQHQDEGPSTFHGLSHAERGSKKARETRLRVSARPSQVDRERSGRAVMTSGTTSGYDQVEPVGAEASLSNLFYQGIPSPGLAPSVQVHYDALSPHSESQQRSLLSNYSGSPAYTGTPSQSPYSPAGPGFTYGQTSPAPPPSPLNSASTYPQSPAYYGVLTPNSAQQGIYNRTSMPHHPDPHGMTSPHGASAFSAQQDVRGPRHPLGQNRGSDQANRAQHATRLGGGLSITSPGTQPLASSPHYQQWRQAGEGFQANYPYTVSHHSSPTTMAPTASSSGYISPSYPSSHNPGAISSDRSNNRHQVPSPMRYAPTQRAAGPHHGFVENGGYLSAQMFSSPHSTGIASPTQGTMYQDRFRRQTPQDSITTTYQARGFETPSPNAGWSPHSEYPQQQIIPSPNSQASVSYLPNTSHWFPNPSTSEKNFDFLD